MRLTRTGAISSARLAVRAGSAAVTALTMLMPIAGRRPAVPPMKISVPPSHFVGRVARDVKCQQEVLADKIANLREVHIGEASVVRPAGCHHHVVDCREVTEEPIESNRIRGVEGRGTQGINLTGSVLEALGIPAREDHLGAFCMCPTCRLESNASATADHNNGLPKELRFPVDERGISYGAQRPCD